MWPPYRTKIVCTLGPATASREMIERLIRAGMNIARLRGDSIYLNDGFVQREVQSVDGHGVRLRVVMGGEIGSRKGVQPAWHAGDHGDADARVDDPQSASDSPSRVPTA